MNDYVNSVNPYPGLAIHDADVLRTRSVSPAIAAGRGYETVTAEQANALGFTGHQARAGLRIPRFNTQGINDADQMRPHAPRLDDDGKPRKYEWATGTLMAIDVHPLARHLLDRIDVPIILTESSIKADAILSNAPPDSVCPLSISGVWGYVRSGVPLPDFRDIVWCEKKRGKVVRKRQVAIGFDSDTGTNPKVANARHDLTGVLERKGAAVDHIDVPDGPGGDKQGIDDALANGFTLAQLRASAHAPRRPHPENSPDDPDRQRIAELEATVEEINAELRLERARHRADFEILGDNRRPAQERITAVFLAREAERIIQHEKMPHAGEETATVDQSGGILLNVGALARIAGTSPKHTTDCLKKFEAENVIQRSVTRVSTGKEIVTRDGEIQPEYVSIVRITPVGDIQSLRGSLLMSAPERLPKKKPAPVNHCLDHPTADVITRIHDECEICHKQIGDVRDRRRSAGTAPDDAPLETRTIAIPLNTPEVLSERTRRNVVPLPAPTVSLIEPLVCSDLDSARIALNGADHVTNREAKHRAHIELGQYLDVVAQKRGKTPAPKPEPELEPGMRGRGHLLASLRSPEVQAQRAGQGGQS